MGMLTGFWSSKKDARSKIEPCTVVPTGYLNTALNVLSSLFTQILSSDVVESGTTASSVIATSHVAIVGDRIRFTSGTNSGIEVTVVATEANSIEIGQSLSIAPGVGDTFDILRFTSPKVDSSGVLQTSASGGGGVDPVGLKNIALATIDPATEAKQDTGNTSLATIAAKDFATQTTLASLLIELQLKADLSETQPVSLAGFTTLTEGEKNISAAATPEAIGSGAIKRIIITAKETNTGTIWVKSTVTNNTLGRPLLPLQAETLEISNLNLIFLKATVNGEGVTFLAFS